MPSPRKRRPERARKSEYVPAYQPPSVISPLAHSSSVEFLAAYATYCDRTDAPMPAAQWRAMAIMGDVER